MLTPGSDGEFLLTLQSNVARDQFGDKETVSLTFEAERAYHHPDWELINPTHPYLEVIRNDLASSAAENPRLSEAYFPPQPVSSSGKITIPHISFDGPISNVEYQTVYRPHFLLTYKAIFESDERQDYVLRLCFDARTGQSKFEIVPQLAKLPLQDGRPPDIANHDDLCNIEDVLKKGRHEIDARVGAEVAAITVRHSEQLSKEKERLEKHYNKQIELTDKRDEDGRKKFREALQKEVDDFEKKYAFRSRIYLTSILLLWIPMLSYRLTVAGGTTTFFVDGAEYDSGSDRISFQTCSKCGNKEYFSICCAAKHAFCGDSSCASKSVCGDCRDVYCEIHGTDCSLCAAECCLAHSLKCPYGTHPANAAFCLTCSKVSFDQQNICAECAADCEICARVFPQEMITSCRVGDESFCFGHAEGVDGDFCSECGDAVCKLHGRTVEENEWACIEHSHESSCCQNVFGYSHLTSCAGDRNELLCVTHRTACAVGAEAVCDSHIVKSWQGEPLCPIHVGKCIRCIPLTAERIYRTDHLSKCSVCSEKVCKDHIERCQVCQANDFCVDHEDSLEACQSCSRISCAQRGCSIKSSVCRLCKMSYCRHCFGSSGICFTCAKPDPVSRVSTAVPILEAVAKTTDLGVKQAAEIMLKSIDKCSVRAAENHTFKVVTMHFKPSQWTFWKKEKKLRVVVNRNGSLVNTFLESK